MHCMIIDRSELPRLLLHLIRFGAIAKIDHDAQHYRDVTGRFNSWLADEASVIVQTCHRFSVFHHSPGNT